MTRLRIELVVEPFVNGSPGPHVEAAADSLIQSGFAPEVGPFGTSLSGPASTVLQAAAAAAAAAFANDATSMTISIQRVPSGQTEQYLDSIRPLLERLGATVVTKDRMRPGDEPLLWNDEVAGAVRIGERVRDLVDAVPRLIQKVEVEFGSPLANLNRDDKQRAVHRLDELGAFNLRAAVDTVAEGFGVSRVTVYNYLSAMRRASAPQAPVLE